MPQKWAPYGVLQKKLATREKHGKKGKKTACDGVVRFYSPQRVFKMQECNDFGALGGVGGQLAHPFAKVST
jgi:hypothetical protein